MESRKLLIEIDFINKMILPQSELASIEGINTTKFAVHLGKKQEIDEDLIENFLSNVVDEFWHTDKDKLDFFKLYSDGTYFCQRQKMKYDFKTESTYYNTYKFTGATAEQAKEFCKQCHNFLYVVNELKTIKIERLVEEVDKEVLLYEKRFWKLKRQKTEMLINSDWRVLSDIEEEYDGERARWVAWRKWIRTQTLLKPEDERFGGSGLNFFKYTYELKWPLDPNNYLKKYPNGKLADGVTDAPEYLDVNDPLQWTKHDSEASTDFFHQREENMYMLSSRHKIVNRKVSADVKKMMELMGLNNTHILPADWEKFYVYDSELDE